RRGAECRVGRVQIGDAEEVVDLVRLELAEEAVELHHVSYVEGGEVEPRVVHEYFAGSRRVPTGDQQWPVDVDAVPVAIHGERGIAPQRAQSPVDHDEQ